MEDLGNKLNRMVREARGALFNQGEIAQLTYGAFNAAIEQIQKDEKDEIEVSFPVGYRPDKTTMNSTRKYNKEQILHRYQYLAFHQLAINEIVQLVTLVEALLSDLVRVIIMKYPKKLDSKKTVPMKMVLGSSSIDELHIQATDGLINELSYKSPEEFAKTFQDIASINLLETPAFHRYVEVKATRDIYIHNRGVANETYIRKSGAHVRVPVGVNIPVDIQYFLESYETCLQITDWLEKNLHETWYSSFYENNEKNYNHKRVSKEDPIEQQ